jgi:Tfp pilus assembly protein PilF
MKNPHSISMHTFGSQKRKAFLCWMTLVCASHVFAQTTADEWQPGQIVSLNVTQSDPHNEVQKALRQAKYPLALKLIEQALTKNPRDPQMLFWKAYVFEKQNQPELAQPIYLDLTQQFPELPEPHNNLGVLLAASGQYGLAQVEFEAALRSNPAYALAQENLADVLLHQASLLYQRALSNDSKLSSAKNKLELLQPALTPTQKP